MGIFIAIPFKYLTANPREARYSHLAGVGARLHPPLNLLYSIKDAPSGQDVSRPSQFPFVARGDVRNPTRPPPIRQAALLSTVETASGHGRAGRIELIKAATPASVAGFMEILLNALYDRRGCRIMSDKLSARGSMTLGRFAENRIERLIQARLTIAESIKGSSLSYLICIRCVVLLKLKELKLAESTDLLPSFDPQF